VRIDDSLDARLALKTNRRDTCRERKEERAGSEFDEGEGQTYIGPQLPREVSRLLR
jgi:hypothetical protein